MEHLAIFLSLAFNLIIVGYLIFTVVKDSSGEDRVVTALIQEIESLKKRVKHLETFQDPKRYNKTEDSNVQDFDSYAYKESEGK